MSRVIYNNATITNFINNVDDITASFKLLHDNICVDAYTKSGFYDDMKCHTGTRQLILERLENWVAAPGNADRLITWLDGPMGSGKTSVAVTIAERVSAKDKLIGSFIFRRGQPGRDNDSRFVATLAYQMALSIPLTRSFIEEQISYHQSIFRQSLSHQMDVLILKPLRKMRSQNPDIDVATLPHLIIVDGLDECGPDRKDGEGERKGQEREKEEQQLGVLELLHRLALAQDVLPFSVLVHSRPEIHIKHWFGMESHANITNRFTLDSSYKPDDDTRLFVTHGLLNLLETHPFCIHLRGTNWPCEVLITDRWSGPELVNAIDLIVARSEGQFLYASIVMRFISSKGHPPSERLLQILQRHPRLESNILASPYTTLDALYTQILENTSNPEVVRRILALNWLLEDLELPETDALRILLSVLDISMHDFNYSLQQLAAILTLDMNPFLRFQHSSLAEFLDLQSRERSRHWCLDNYLPKIAHDVAVNAFKLFSTESSVAAQLSCIDIVGLTIPYSAACRNRHEDWRSSAIVKQLKGFCDFMNSSYHAAVLRVLTSGSLCVFLATTSILFRCIKYSWPETYCKKWIDKFTSHIRTLVEPYVKPYLKNPCSFAIFLCHVFDIPASNTHYIGDIPSPNTSPFAFRQLFEVEWGETFSSFPEWLLHVFSVPNLDFLCQAFTILLKHAGQPSVMFCQRGIAQIIDILEHKLVISQELWLAILDCDEYFTPYLRHRLHDRLFVQDLRKNPLAFRRLHYQHQYCPTPILPLQIALGQCYWEAPKNTRDNPINELWFLKDSSDGCQQITIPSVPPLARYMVFCSSAGEAIPVPEYEGRCTCTRRSCFNKIPKWMRI